MDVTHTKLIAHRCLDITGDWHLHRKLVHENCTLIAGEFVNSSTFSRFLSFLLGFLRAAGRTTPGTAMARAPAAAIRVPVLQRHEGDIWTGFRCRSKHVTSIKGAHRCRELMRATNSLQFNYHHLTRRSSLSLSLSLSRLLYLSLSLSRSL